MPEEAEVHCWPAGWKSCRSPRTRRRRRSRRAPSGHWGGPAGWPAAHPPGPYRPETCVPGAMMSGFLRPSSVGPRPEKDATSRRLFASPSAVPRASRHRRMDVLEGTHGDDVLARTGLPTEFVVGPSLPRREGDDHLLVARVGHRGGRPAARRGRRASYSCASRVYALEAGAPAVGADAHAVTVGAPAGPRSPGLVNRPGVEQAPRQPTFTKGATPRPVLVAGRVLVRGAGQAHVAAGRCGSSGCRDHHSPGWCCRRSAYPRDGRRPPG